MHRLGIVFMTRRLAAISLAALGLALIGAAADPAGAAFLVPMFGDHRPPPDLSFTYHGWRVNAASAARVQRPAKTIKAIKAQLDIVEQVGLPPKVLDFMRGVPVPASSPEPGHYTRARGVEVHAKNLDDKRPILLRQMLYAFQDQMLPQGYANPDVARLRREAAARRVWPNTATMLKDDPDYFAMTASAYLYGTITREPYTRADLCRTQPDACAWLADLFDGGKVRR
jgi:hypothetical protein